MAEENGGAGGEKVEEKVKASQAPRWRKQKAPGAECGATPAPRPSHSEFTKDIRKGSNGSLCPKGARLTLLLVVERAGIL